MRFIVLTDGYHEDKIFDNMGEIYSYRDFIYQLSTPHTNIYKVRYIYVESAEELSTDEDFLAAVEYAWDINDGLDLGRFETIWKYGDEI